MARLILYLQFACVIGAGWFTLCFIGIALLSIGYPYPLEWMEGQSMDVIQRVMEGKSIYVEPSIEYVPFIYPPLYFYIGAVAAQIFGLDFFAARFISLACALGTGVILYRWVRHEQGSRPVAFITAGLFYSTYMLSMRWFDVARIDSLYMFLSIAALYLFVHYHSMRAAVIAGALFAAAFFTKQNALIIAIPILLLGWFTRRDYTLVTLTVMCTGMAACLVITDVATEGWFGYYAFEVPAAHRIAKRFIVNFWVHDLLANLWPLMLILVASWGRLFREDRQKALTYLALAAGLVGAAYAGRLHRYGEDNVLIPAHACLALCTGLGLAYWLRTQKLSLAAPAFALALLQMALLFYNPLNAIPNDYMRSKNDEFMKKLAAIEGDVYIPEIQFIPKRVGKKSYNYGFAAIDIFHSRTNTRDYVHGILRRELTQALSEHRFSAIVSAGLMNGREMNRYYKTVENEVFSSRYVSGYHPPPFRLMLPRKPGETPP